jgi:hypothetical protein
MHVTVLDAVDDGTRSRLVAAFSTVLGTHVRADGEVTFDAPYAVISAQRR